MTSINPAMHYQTHIFCCINERAPEHPRSCCAARGSGALRDYMKTRAKELGIKDIRINNAGCLERCELGPTMVIYPEGVWYHYDTKEDIDEILDRHVIKGERVDRLLLEPGQKFPKPVARTYHLLKVAETRNETADVKRLELRHPSGQPLPPFEAGAHVDIVVEGGERRSYSIASDPREGDRYVLGVLRERAGRGGSAWIHQNVEKGDTVQVAAPINNFKLVDGAGEYVLIAGGIGITPILAMGHALRARNAKFKLHYCTRSPENTAFMAEVKDVFGDRVVFHHDGGDPSKGIKLNSVLAVRPEGAHLYVCGPGGLIRAALAAASHWPEETVHREYFTPVTLDEGWVDEAFEISLARQKKILTVPVGKTILSVVRESGVAAESSCEDGLCGACRTVLLGGKAEHRDSVLSLAEKEQNKAVMICVSRAKQGERLILDI